MRVRSCWSGANAEAPIAAAQREVVRSIVEALPSVAARSLAAEQSFEEGQS